MKKNRRETGHQSSFFYRCSLCAAGGMLMGVAAVLFLAGGNGADSMNTLLQGMSQALQLSVDACNNLLSFTFVLAAFFIDRKQIHAGTIIFPVVTTITIRILTPLVHADTLLHRVLFCMAGIGIIAMSIALSIYADCGKNPYDCVTFGLMKRTFLSCDSLDTGWRYACIRYDTAWYLRCGDHYQSAGAWQADYGGAFIAETTEMVT